MANTSSRTLRLLTLLQTHRFWAGGELASRLEVSERTLRRDVDRLRDLGYPVRSTRGLDGGYQLEAGGSMPPLVVDEHEAIALVVALGNAPATGELGDATLSVLSKVVQVLPATLRRRAEALRAVTVGVPFANAPEVSATVLAVLAAAIRDHERVRFSYTARGGQSAGDTIRRHVEPHHLVTVGTRWYLVAYDLDRLDWRSFRIDRMADPAGTRSTFRPRGSREGTLRHTCARAWRGEINRSPSPPASPPRPIVWRCALGGGAPSSPSTRTPAECTWRSAMPRGQSSDSVSVV